MAESGPAEKENTGEYSPTLAFEDDEKTKRKGCTAGRAVNGCIICNYFLLMLCALIVAGTMGVLHYKLSATQYQDVNPNSNRTCILFSRCSGQPGSKQCDFLYNNSGACDLIIGGFVIMAFAALCYIIVSIIRIIFATNIWLTVVLDILMNLGLAVCFLILGITQSVGLAVTCKAINEHYGIGGLGNCSAKPVPSADGYHFYREVNISQGTAWFCFMFSMFGLIIFVVRSCIFCRRRAVVPSMSKGAPVLTADDKYRGESGPTEERPTVI